jgi:ATP-dependent DNA ligase
VESQVLSYLILGRVAPSFVESEFNYSEKGFLGLLRDLAKARGMQENVNEKRKEVGDIGDTLEYFSNVFDFKSKKVILLDIYDILWEIVNTSGEGSVERKNKIIVDVLSNMSPLEAKYFSRIICGSLRLG